MLGIEPITSMTAKSTMVTLNISTASKTRFIRQNYCFIDKGPNIVLAYKLNTKSYFRIPMSVNAVNIYEPYFKELKRLFNKSKKQKNPALWLYRHDARKPLFM